MRRPRARFGPGLNGQLVVPVVSGAVLAVGLGMVVCFGVALIGGDGGALAFGLPAAVLVPAAALGLATAPRLAETPLRARDGFFAVTMAWVAAAATGAVPFLIADSFDRVVDALFESMSGFTTTGATLLEDVEAQPDAILLWRSISQWIGGVGIVVLVVAIAPATGLASQRAFYAETTGVTAERLTPRIADTAKILSGIYLALTAAALAAYAVAGMSVWDALNHTLTTIATGGFSTRTASIAAFDSLAIELVAIVFMTVSAVNFAFYWRAIRGRGIWPQFAEVRLFLLILAVSIAVLTLALAGEGGWRELRHAAFTATSLLTSTGYTTVDFDAWGAYERAHLLLLMLFGGCAGSTAGGLKIIRVLLLAKTARQEVQRQLQPRAVQVLRIRGRVYSEELRRGVLAFTAIYLIVAAVGTLAMAVTGLDLETAFASAWATVNIIGPGMGEVGATESYAAVPQGGLWILSALMLIGRLEIFTVLVLLTPAFWRPNIA